MESVKITRVFFWQYYEIFVGLIFPSLLRSAKTRPCEIIFHKKNSTIFTEQRKNDGQHIFQADKILPLGLTPSRIISGPKLILTAEKRLG